MSLLRFNIDHRKKISLFEQVKQEIQKAIENQNLPAGYVFSDLKHIAELNQIDENILKDVLQALTETNMIKKINHLFQVNSIIFESAFFESVIPYEKAIIDSGYSLEIRNLKTEIIMEHPILINVSDTKPLGFFEWDRVYFANNIPIIRVISHYPLQLFSSHDLNGLFHQIHHDDRFKISSSTRDIKSIIPNSNINLSLNQTEDSSCLQFIIVNYNQDIIIEYSTAYASLRYAIFTQKTIYNPYKKAPNL